MGTVKGLHTDPTCLNSPSIVVTPLVPGKQGAPEDGGTPVSSTGGNLVSAGTASGPQVAVGASHWGQIPSPVDHPSAHVEAFDETIDGALWPVPPTTVDNTKQ